MNKFKSFCRGFVDGLYEGTDRMLNGALAVVGCALVVTKVCK